MIRTEWQIRIERSVEDVFDFVTDLRNDPRWNPDASDVVKHGDGPVGVGTVFEEDVQPFGHCVATIDIYERPSAAGYAVRSAKADVSVRFHLADAGNGATDVTCEAELRLKGVLRLLEPVGTRVAARGEQTSRGPLLKRALESL